MADRAKSVMGSSKKKSSKKKKKSSGKKIHSMRVRHTSNGRYSVDHFDTPEAESANMPSETHGINDMDELQEHMAQNMQPQEQGEEQAEAQPQAKPQMTA